MYSITCRDNGTYTDVPMKRCIDPEGRALFARYRVFIYWSLNMGS